MSATDPKEAEPGPSLEDVRCEVRFAVVMYGGVSLAIYINGVTQELYRLVCATSPGRDGARARPFASLRGSERVYRKLAHVIAHPRRRPQSSGCSRAWVAPWRASWPLPSPSRPWRGWRAPCGAAVCGPSWSSWAIA